MMKEIDLMPILEKADQDAIDIAWFLQLFENVVEQTQRPNLMTAGHMITQALDNLGATPRGQLLEALPRLGLPATTTEQLVVEAEPVEDGGITTIKSPEWELVVTSTTKDGFILKVTSPSITGLLERL